MEKDREPKSTRRRDFLKFAGLGTVAGAAAATAGAPEPAAAAEATEGKRLGYRETEHVKKFYRLARY
jgi:hypothetical protein